MSMPKAIEEWMTQNESKHTEPGFLAQCTCALTFHNAKKFEEFKKKHEATSGHTFKVISP